MAVQVNVIANPLPKNILQLPVSPLKFIIGRSTIKIFQSP